MKRTFLAVLSAALLLFGVPSVASAHHGKRHTACVRTHRHHAKCARAHVLRFGSSASATSSTGSAPATPTSGETAGTVTTFASPMLTITLNDKKTEVSGKITEDTRIECESSTPTGSGGDDEGDDDGGSGTPSGDSGFGAGDHPDSAMATAADSQGDQGDDGNNTQPCPPSALTTGAVVREAELVLGSQGAVWEKVLLVS